MGRKKKNTEKTSRINLTLTPELNSRLNKYCVEIAKRNGKITYAVRTRICRMALKEWLDKHEKDLTLKF